MTFTFYATVSAERDVKRYMIPDVAYLFPASSWWRVKMRPPRMPDGVESAADCGGFVATLKWGDYRYSPGQYVDWLGTWTPTWAAMMDYCCEDEITCGKPGIVHERQDKTTAMARHFWTEYRDSSFTWVPTIQGWTVDDYERHALAMKPIIGEMSDHYGPESAFRVGIGTLCARASVPMILEVLDRVRSILPDVSFHLWGVKLAALKSPQPLENVISVDSAAWDTNGLGRSVEINTERKTLGMTQIEYSYQVLLPRYLAKVAKARSKPRQGVLI